MGCTDDAQAPPKKDVIAALLNRATSSAVSAAVLCRPGYFRFWQGVVHGLKLSNRTDLAYAAELDSRNGGYLPPHGLEAAFARFGAGIDQMTLGEVQQILTGSGIQLTPEPIPDPQLAGAYEFEDRVGAVVHPNTEQASPVIQSHDGAGEHAVMVAPGAVSSDCLGVSK